MEQSAIRTLGAEDFARQFGNAGSLPELCRRLVDEGDFRHRVLSGRAREDFILQAVRQLELALDRSGAHRLDKWANGWQENVDDFRASDFAITALQPKFVHANRPVRLEGQYIQPVSSKFYFDYMRVLISWVFLHHFAALPAVCEFGCGTGLNLVFGGQARPDCHLIGTDWALSSQTLIADIQAHLGIDVEGRRFDLFHPDDGFTLSANCGVLTVGSLEQVGGDFEPFLDYLRRQRPGVCVNLEPINELLDENDLFDWVAIRYSQKRNYLSGYLTRLRAMAAAGEIEILQEQRTFGSAFNDGHSLVAWRFV